MAADLAVPVAIALALGGAFLANEWSHGGLAEATGLGHRHMLDHGGYHCADHDDPARAGGVVVLDGMATSVAALAALRHDPAVRAALVAGQRSAERGHALVLRELGLEPLLDLRLRAGEGVGAALATGLLAAGDRLRREGARTG